MKINETERLMKFGSGRGAEEEEEMGLTMGLNLLLLMAMVATNLLSLYHLSSTIHFSNSSSSSSSSSSVPGHLVHQLQNIRAAINHLNRLHPVSSEVDVAKRRPVITPDLFLYSQLSPIASGCHGNPDLLQRFMNYTPFSFCPSDSDLAEALILRGCHPLPRRRCFTRTPVKPSEFLPLNPFSSIPDSNIIWSKYSCKSLSCLNRLKSNLGFDPPLEITRFMTYESELDLPIPQLLQIAKSQKSVLRLGIDIGGGTGTFAARMKLYNVTVVTTTMNLGAPYNEAASLRGLIPLHVPLQQRLPVFDGTLDLVRCGHAVNRWIPNIALEFLLFDVDRVLRGGGFLWLDHFFCKADDLDKIYTPLIGKLSYRKLKWATESKPDSGKLKNGEVYLTALLQKPIST